MRPAEYTLRRSREEDIPAILRLYHQAQDYFKQEGIDQWQDGYPEEFVVRDDVIKGYSHVLETEGRIVGTAILTCDGEPDYDVIEGGSWSSAEPFAAIHRVTVDNECKGCGLAGRIFQGLEEQAAGKRVAWVRIDTHEDNRSMQRFLEKQGYGRRGVIHLRRDGAPRIAFEKHLQFQKSGGEEQDEGIIAETL